MDKNDMEKGKVRKRSKKGLEWNGPVRVKKFSRLESSMDINNKCFPNKRRKTWICGPE